MLRAICRGVGGVGLPSTSRALSSSTTALSSLPLRDDVSGRVYWALREPHFTSASQPSHAVKMPAFLSAVRRARRSACPLFLHTPRSQPPICAGARGGHTLLPLPLGRWTAQSATAACPPSAVLPRCLCALTHSWHLCSGPHLHLWIQQGPVNIHEDVRRAMQVPGENHRDAWFSDFFK